jgi:Zn-dependent protease
LEAKILEIILRLPALLLGIGLHEWAHAWAADKHGDSLPASQGRLSLNPLDHLDPVGTFCIFFAPIGWGKPVMINPSAYKNPLKDQMRIALAGPMMNFLIASVALVVHMLLLPRLDLTTTHGMNVNVVFENIILINICLGAFNLLPLPPLDGSKVLRAFAPVSIAEIIGWLETTGIGVMVLLGLVMSGAVMPVFIIIGVGMAIVSAHIYLAAGFLIFMLVAWKIFLSTFPKYF